ncbi:OprO/OprP family phosphate-selective porin [Lutimonas saemankumensis]|uniref:OprO/OprP family phosphate-selective porin n=1 Tax=Lutimonas saemankumensis TaxID=483016 RepID=UPI001CD42990|nr:OprO/OprP family phosphate-selective porin [Lutimonas saemankumensis]MCA0930862.1 OprO/OprP family phosphate-selective porin [Lutimonas saemankumensis]
MRWSLFKIFCFQLALMWPGVGKIYAQIESTHKDIQFYEPSNEVKTNFLKDLLKSKNQNKQDSLRQIPELNLGGALRLNYAYKDYDDENKDRLGDFGFEMFRIDADITYKDIFFLVEFRWYTDFNAIRQGYFGYHVTDNTSFQIGIHQVPFGMLPYASHSFWFNATYYLGFEDDYDTGVKLIHDNEKWNLQAAFYKNPEYTDSERYGRYSFDLVTDEVQTNEEINQFNLRAVYKWRLNNHFLMNLGASAETGQIYNKTTEKKGNRRAFSFHSNMFYKKWNFQLQWINYEFNPKNPEGISEKTVQFGAFMFPFLVSSKANVYSFNIAKQIDIKGKYLDNMKLYLDTSMVQPKRDFGSASKQIVVGTTLIKRGLYAYFDYIFGQNMWFSGGPGIGLSHPEDQNWNSRLNINLGYYF